jgi:hypothetical protein
MKPAFENLTTIHALFVIIRIYSQTIFMNFMGNRRQLNVQNYSQQLFDTPSISKTSFKAWCTSVAIIFAKNSR